MHKSASRGTVLAKIMGLLFFLLPGSSSLAAQDAPISKPTYEVKIHYNFMVRMRDGVRLSTDIYRPDAGGKFPVLLVRNPYNNGDGEPYPRVGRYWASRGYVFLHQDTRGRNDSEGDFNPIFQEPNDGYDALEWAGTQQWSNRKVGMWGLSYLAHVQWRAAWLRSPYQKAIMPIFSPLNTYLDGHPGGGFEFGRIKWATLMDGRTNQNFDYNWDEDLMHLPLRTLDRALGHDLPFWQELIRHPHYDTYWELLDDEKKIPEIEVPALNIGGWFDTFLRSTLAAYTGMITRGREATRASQKLVIGPWPHGLPVPRKAGEIDFGPDAQLDLDRLAVRWMDYHLKGIDNGIMQEPPIQIFVMGTNRWRSEYEWPLARTQFTKYYLHSQGNAQTLNGDGSLSTDVPGQEPVDQYVYDPEDPVPTKGGGLTGANPDLIPGPFDQTEIEKRADVLVFTSSPLQRDLEVTGPLTVVLYAASDARDTDFMAKLVDVHPNGRAYGLIDNMIRARYRESFSSPTLLEPGKVYAFEINLYATSNVFKKGHRIRLEISSSNFPRFDRNQNTGRAFGMDDRVQKATQTIHHSARHPSHILLPVIPGPR